MKDDGHQVGSVAEEAAKLFEALQDRAVRDPGGAAGRGSEMLAGLGALLGDVGSPTDSGSSHGAECRSCPVCRGIALFRGISPEVKHHLAMAADSLLQAVTEAMETRGLDGSDGHRPHDGGEPPASEAPEDDAAAY